MEAGALERKMPQREFSAAEGSGIGVQNGLDASFDKIGKLHGL